MIAWLVRLGAWWVLLGTAFGLGWGAAMSWVRAGNGPWRRIFVAGERYGRAEERRRLGPGAGPRADVAIEAEAEEDVVRAPGDDDYDLGYRD